MKVSFHRQRRQAGWIAVGLAVAAVSVPAAAARPVPLSAATTATVVLGHPDESTRIVRPAATLGHPDESTRIVRPVVTDPGPIVLRRTGPVRVIEPPTGPAAAPGDDGIDWTDAGVGAGVGLALGLGLLSATALLSRRRRMMAHPS